MESTLETLCAEQVLIVLKKRKIHRDPRGEQSWVIDSLQGVLGTFHRLARWLMACSYGAGSVPLTPHVSIFGI